MKAHCSSVYSGDTYVCLLAPELWLRSKRSDKCAESSDREVSVDGRRVTGRGEQGVQT